ncbi:MoaB/Mog domain-containing protein [Schizothecium vesticola]|uniref:MoaB/Mog domain-containing protein n=1 Tax=Schizothecium vesticola TaxID=314040 RepID=A0AA40K5D3_9PEZI|nr:MoaB/Mog domain-containing protein [Schizothecium vesticola]
MSSNPALKAAVLIVSTTAAKDPSTDAAGAILRDVFDQDGGGQWSVVATHIVSDDAEQIKAQITAWTDPPADPVNLIITTGGTGFAISDQTPEAVSSLLDKHAPGLVHGMLSASLALTPFAMMSRPVAGVRHRTVILTLPGSPKGARENLQAVLKMLPHACKQAAGAVDSRALHAGGVKKLEQDAGHVPPPATVTTRVTPALVGAVLAADVEASEDVPAFRASIVDGYAVVAPADGDMRGVFPVTAVSHASASTAEGEGELKAGEVARITTGAPLPAGATSVVMEEAKVEVFAAGVRAGENVREVGSDVRRGTVILKKGDQVSSVGGEMGLLAAVGTGEVRVYKRPVVGVLSTGDEIVEHDREGGLRRGEVRDTNRPTLVAATRGWGFEVVDLGIVKDTAGSLEEVLRGAMREVDLVITTGGVSMGELDLLKPTIERALGGTIHFGRVAMKPGKPTTFATVPVKNNEGERVSKVIFSLPGNPASALVTFHLFVLPALHQMSGVQPPGLPRVPVVLDHDMALDKARPEYHRAVVSVTKDGTLSAVSTGGQRSSKVGSLKGANALLSLLP